MEKRNIVVWLDYVAVAIIVITFFVISYCGFFTSDDIGPDRNSIIDVFRHTKWFYFHLGGRYLSVTANGLFSRLLGDNKLWYDIVNTLFFLSLIMICGTLIFNDKKIHIRIVLLFALMFWLLCPDPGQTLFWAAGSITHMWANVLTFLFLWLFFKYKGDDFCIAGKLGLFIISVFFAAEFIPCASICGAFVVYYAFHLKEFRRNAVPIVIGYIIGSVLVLFAPGNFLRAADEINASAGDRVKELLSNPIQEVVKYKALWLFMIVLVWGWIRNQVIVKAWVKNNLVLLLSLGWSVVAFSVVFRPANRALFFPEVLSLVLFLIFMFDNYKIFGIPFLDKTMSTDGFAIRSAILVLLFVVFMVDASFAVAETKKQSKINDALLEEIAGSNGNVALDQVIPSHRMAYAPSFPSWTWEPLADRFGFDSVHIYPYYCQEKYYKQGPPLENIYIDEVNYENDNDVFGKYVKLIARIESEKMQGQSQKVVIAIDYSRPRKWYKTWLDKRRNYQYDRTEVVERKAPDVCFDGYCYYVMWFGRDNAKNLKRVNYELK